MTNQCDPNQLQKLTNFAQFFVKMFSNNPRVVPGVFVLVLSSKGSLIFGDVANKSTLSIFGTATTRPQ